MLLVCYLLVFALLTTHLSPTTARVAASSALTASCLDCPLEDEDSSSSSRGKLSFNPIIPVDEDYLKTIALASSSPSLLGRARGVGLSPQQQKARFYHATQQQQQHHQKILAQQQHIVPASSSSSSSVAAAISAPIVAPPSNLLHVYTLLNKGSAQEPRLLIDEYYLQDPGIPLPSSRIVKKAERGMLVDVLDYVSKPDDRNRRVGQNMRSSG